MVKQRFFSLGVGSMRLFVVGLFCLWSMAVQAGWQESLQGLLKGKNQQPSADSMASALREALGNGVQQAVGRLGKTDGFWGNAAARIHMPKELQTTEKVLRKLGQSRQVDEFVLTLNRAAEQAVPVSRDIFIDGIKHMTVTDAKQIIQGPDDAATQYFRRSGEPNLRERFLPIIQHATQQAGATRAYQRLQQDANNKITFMKLNWVDIDVYVTDRALDALFGAIADEEKRIRRDSVARTSDLLKQVFGWAQRR